ncbi:phage integrase SAM-like domain-containing protein [Maribacter sp. 1_MG-2023]|uniref:phage integrase SAM-like domain-containing protein n=1 Tax=Maribacter sp. 1_MG-2023 TaxID=3062677 RepID=UPI0026E2516F|nr:phage integrase SAM-like domain-containing protein [Maribacter sp. 1_MG-2023]MDO6473600.1 phage integrase SAM-like domain-containing protein [Maribacter sp. 1_MG-2023]
MAKINFIYRGKKENGKLSIRLINGKDIDYRLSTPILSKKEYWFKRTSKNGKTINKHVQPKDFAKNTDVTIKEHKAYLIDIQESILKLFTRDSNNGVPITSEWFKTTIQDTLYILDTKDKINTADAEQNQLAESVENRKEEIKQANLLANAIKGMFIKYGTNRNELKKYKVTHRLLLKYQEHTKQEFTIKDLNANFADHFKNWAYNEMQYRKSYINTQLKKFRSSAVRAYENDEQDIIEVSKTLRSFKMFKDVYKDKVVVWLNYDELDKIDKKELSDPKLIDAKKAILIGCETGLRYSDQNKLIDTNIKNVDGVNYWEFRTDKTDTIVQITISDRILYLLNKYGLPQTNYPSNGVKLNEDIKEVCKLSEINEKIKGSKATVTIINGKKETRNIIDLHSKHSLITTRTFRRSFATNYYGSINTSLIMNITGHATEQMLKSYINRGNTDNIASTKAQFDEYHEKRREKKKNIKLTIIPNAVNE